MSYLSELRSLGFALAMIALTGSANGCVSEADADVQVASESRLGEEPTQVSAQVGGGSCGKSTFSSYTNIPGYQRLAKAPMTGPYEAVLETNAGWPEWTIYRPKDLGARQHPVVVWGNGGCLKNGTLFGQIALELASHGIIAVVDGKVYPANADPIAGGIRELGGGGAGPMVTTLDWLTKENEQSCSPLFHKLNLSKVGVSGQSCGGMMALAAAGDKRVSTVLINNSGQLFQVDPKIYAALHTTVGYLIGGPTDMAYKSAEADFKAITNVPVFYANNPIGHHATWDQINAGEFGRVALGWFKWQLLDDPLAAKMFVGPDCELCKSGSKWTVKNKNME